MNIFSLMLIISSMTYFFVGVYGFMLDKKAVLNRIFLAVNLCFGMWPFACALYISAQNLADCIFWYKIGTLGFYMFIGVFANFFLIYTQKFNLLKKWWVYVILYLPSAFFIYMVFAFNFYAKSYFYGNNGWAALTNTDSLWFWLANIHYITYIVICLYLCYRWRKKVKSTREKKQSGIILISCFSAFVLGTVITLYISVFKPGIPDISPIAGMIWAVGILYGIARYKLMSLTPTIAAEDIFHTIADSVILVNPDGFILNANSETQRLLGYDNGELIGTPVKNLFPEGKRSEDTNITELLKQCPLRNFESAVVTKSGANIPVILSAAEHRDKEDTSLGYILAARDIRDLKEAESRLRHLAHHDSLTNLANRLLFNDIFNREIVRAKRSNLFVALILLDLVQFKEVNDVYGHNSGDLLLVEVAERLVASVRKSDVVARLGGDEFIIMLNDLKKPGDYEIIVQKILDGISKPYTINSVQINITASIGISIFPSNGNDIEILMKNADLAMYSAKKQGKNTYQLFSPSMSESVIEKMNLENSLHKALENNELTLHYQVVIDISTGKITAVDALVRWKHPKYGVILPSRFIQIAEESGLIIPIGEWVIKTACAQAVLWQKAGYPPVRISVNLSEKQFAQKNLTEKIMDILQETGLDPKCLLLEITESTALKDINYTIDTLKKIQKHGIMITIDNFGNGYSSLLSLRQLPIYAIKIDRYFIRNIVNDPECAAIVAGIIAMAHNIKLKVIAEGIENKDQLTALRSLKWEFVGSPICDGVQGYLINSPSPSNIIEELFDKQRKYGKIYNGNK